MDLIPASSNTSADPLVLQMTESAVKLSNIQTTVVGSSRCSGKTLLLNGKIQEDERRGQPAKAHVPGRIEQLFVTFTGEPIRKGQKLATIYSPELITAQQELLEALKLQDVNAHLPEAARNKLRFWKIPQTTIEEICQWPGEGNATLFAENTAWSPTARRVSIGDYVKQGQVLFARTNLDRVWVLFDAYEEDLAHIRLGDKIEFSTPSCR
ncbi:MAG: efflux RND transporter periplasmic adaptor subunit [Saprospiraceae bacterium]